VEQFTWEEVRAFWRTHATRWSAIDYARDPDGLWNVCHPGAPLWLNRFYDRFQRAVFRRLLRRVPPPAAGARALDVGCGAGRWCRVLAERGYAVTGLDLQPELVEANRRRFPGMTFACEPVQEHAGEAAFELASAVTVIQHNPPAQQEAAIRALRRLLKRGGHAIVLEGTRDRDAGMFSRPIPAWRAAFEAAGFRCRAQAPYDYGMFLRLHWVAASLARRLRGAGRAATPADYLAPAPGAGRALLRRASDAARVVAAAGDRLLEPVLMALPPLLPPAQCGFLFEAV